MSDRLSGSRLPWLYLLFLLPMALAAWQLLFHTRVQTDMSAFMPGAKGQAQQILLQQLEQGPAARLWMLTLAHAPPRVLADISGKLAQKAAESPLVNQVMNGNMMLDEATREQLFEYRYLLSDRIGGDSFSQQGLGQMFEELLQTLRSPLSTFSKELFQTDPGGEFSHLLQSFSTGSSGPVLKHGVWFDKQGDKALLLLQSRASGTDLDAQLELRQQLSFWLHELTEGDVPGQSIMLRMGGVPLISLETREHIRQTSQRLSIAATVFMLAFMFFVYRQPRKVLLTALPLLSGVLMGAACVSGWFGSIHGITLAFGITLLGVAVDYPVHLLSHQRKQERLGQTAVRIWPTLALSVLSTVLGFSAMLWTDFPGLAQLGLFSVCGLLTAALVTRYLLPRLAGSTSPRTRRVDKRAAHPSFYLSTAQIGGRHKLVLGLLLILGMAWAIQGKDLWSRDIQALSPVPAEVRLADQQMRQLMGAPEPGHVMLLTADAVQQLLEKQEQMQPLLNEAVSRGYVE
ncbi:MAG: MMPL family transporter, partial [Deltaproteobacteria bacterium]|nr:MMPL family transporter [Deltaproteobacteria bacterium]